MFSDMEGENVVIFARNADKFMRQNLVPSLEMGMIVIHNLKGEPYIRARRWRETMDVDPERVHADHWSEQPHQVATPFLPYLPLQVAQPFIAPRQPGIAPGGEPDANDPGHPGQPAVGFQPMRPTVPAVREQPAVAAHRCLKAYLLHTFQKRIDITAADKFLATFKTQKPKQTCGVFVDLFVTKFEYYITIRWTAAERAAPGFLATSNAIHLQYIRDGLCEEFRMHLDRHPGIITQQQVDDEIQRWSRETVEGRKFYKNCDKAEATHTTSSVYVVVQSVQDDEEEEQPNYSSSTSDNQGHRGGNSRGRGGGLRGRGYNNNGKNPSGRGVAQFKDSEGINQYQQGQDGKMLLNERGHPCCNYCGISRHTRSICRHRLRDVENGIKRNFHPNRGKMSSNNQLRKANQTTESADPLTVITTARQRQQQQSRMQSPRPPAVASTQGNNSRTSTLLPSGLVACNECAHVSSTFEQAEEHTISAHTSRQLALTNGSDRQI